MNYDNKQTSEKMFSFTTIRKIQPVSHIGDAVSEASDWRETEKRIWQKRRLWSGGGSGSWHAVTGVKLVRTL